MAEGNGVATDGMALPPETVIFRIGGEDIPVPAIYFDDLERPEVREPLDALGPELPRQEYIGHVLAIVAAQLSPYRPELTVTALRKRCLAGESFQLIGTMNELLRRSGFPIPETVVPPPANPGTGTSIDAAPNLPSEGSAEDTPAS